MKMLPSARYKIWQNVKKQAPADSIPQKQLLASKPTVAVVNHSRIDVNSAEPVTVLTADIELDSASKLKNIRHRQWHFLLCLRTSDLCR